LAGAVGRIVLHDGDLMHPSTAASTTTAGSVPPGRALVPPWLVHLAAMGWRFLVVLAFGLVLLALAAVLGTVTASVVVAVIIAATFAPYVDALRRRGWSSTKAAGVVCLAVLVIFGGALLLVILALVPSIVAVASAIEAGMASLRASLAEVAVPPEVVTAIQQVAVGISDAVAGVIGSAVGSIATLATIAFLGGFLTFFLLQDGEKAWAWTVSGTSGWRRESLTASGRDALELVGGYLRATAVTAATDAISNFVFLTILGVPLAGPLAVIVLLGGFVPYVGPVLATVMLVLVTWGTVGLTAVVILLALIAVTNVIQRRFIDPLIYPRTIAVHPALVLIALLVGGTLAGYLGLVAALPIVAFVLTTSRSVVNALDIGPEARDAGAGGVPGWLDRLAQWSWRALVLIAVLLVGIAAAVNVPSVILPIVIAVVFAATLEPGAGWLRQRGWSRTGAAAVVTSGAFLAAVAILVLTLVSMVGPLQEIVTTSAGGAEQTEARRLGLAGVVTSIGSGMLEAVAGLIVGLAGFVIALLLAAVLTFFFLRDGPGLWDQAIAGLAPVQRTKLNEAGRGASGVLGGYMVGTGAISLFGAVTQFVIMVVLGIPLALPLAVLSFFGGFVPYIGSFITTGFAFLVTVATGDTTDIIVMGLFTIVFNIVQGNIVAPLVYGKAVNLHPAIVLLAIPAGSAIAGVIGMFLVVPFLGVIATTWRTILHLFDGVEGSPAEVVDPPMPPHAPEPIPEPAG
jgi:putative heme transporter